MIRTVMGRCPRGMVFLGAILALSNLASAALGASGERWPCWRGPGDCGSTETGSYPALWGNGSNLIWKVELPGKGCSTPIVWDRRIFLTAPISGQDAALAFDWSGKVAWQTPLGSERKGKHANGSGCNPSPVTDGRSIFVFFKSGTLAGLNMEGKARWKINLWERYGEGFLYWDYGTSPVLTEKDVVVAVMHHGESYLAAFEKLTGEMRWKVARNYETPEEGDHSYATPIVIQSQGKEAVMVWGGQHLTGHDAADGRLLWTCGDFNPKSEKNWVAVASPVVVGDMAVVPYGRGARLHGVRVGGSGADVGQRIWLRQDTGSFVPTPAAYQGRVYLLRDSGEVQCLEPSTGKTVWEGAFPKESSKYYASPTVAGGKLYAAREDGMVYVAQITRKFEILGENAMGERIIASPVPVENRLYLRGEKHLFCVGLETR